MGEMRMEYQQDGTGPAASQSIIQTDPILPHFPWKVSLLLWRCFHKIKVGGDSFRKEECVQYPWHRYILRRLRLEKKVQENTPKNRIYYTVLVTATHKTGLKIGTN